MKQQENEMPVYYEQIPEHYAGADISITIHYKPSTKFSAELLGVSLGGGSIEESLRQT